MSYRLQSKIVLAVVSYVLQLDTEVVEMLLLALRDLLEYMVRDRIVDLGRRLS